VIIESKENEGFDCIYEENEDLVFRTALHYSKNYYTAQEISQNVFLKLFLELKKKEIENPRAWLLKVTRNCALNDKKRSSHEIASENLEVLSALYECEEDPEEILLSEEHDKLIIELHNEIMDKLLKKNPRWYEAINLAYSYKMPQAEIAHTLGVSLEVVHSVLFRARKWIRRSFRKQYEKLIAKDTRRDN